MGTGCRRGSRSGSIFGPWYYDSDCMARRHLLSTCEARHYSMEQRRPYYSCGLPDKASWLLTGHRKASAVSVGLPCGALTLLSTAAGGPTRFHLLVSVYGSLDLALMPIRRHRLALVRMNSMRAVNEQPAAQPLTSQPVA